jgi:hypothetical protein
MEHLGNKSLFTSHFVLGGTEVNRKFTKTKTDVLEALHMWLNFKDNDQGMENYSIVRTRSVDFLEIIELQTFKEITQELHRSYCLEYPYSSRKDFLKHVFEYTIHDLERFLELDLYCHGEVLNENKYCFYTVFMDDAMQFIDFAISGEKEIEHYQQYYRAVLYYLKSFEEEEETTIAPPTSKNQPPELETPTTFDELFHHSDLVAPCLDILKEIEPPLIDTENNYIGGLKGAFCIWVDEMQRQGIVKYQSDRKVYASLIPQKINGFSIDESMFGKHHNKAENNYRTDIKTKVSAIKLSQNSHKGKLGK